MPEPSQDAQCFAAILEAELAEVRERQHQLSRNLTTALNRSSETSDSQKLYPTPRRKPEEPRVRFEPLPHAEAASKPEAQPKKQSGTFIHQANQAGLFGVAFSGGGIRSATFNLGVLQGLARRKLLRRIDYLSTISGGGYIGAWLAAWIHRRGMHEVETRLGAARKDQPHFKEPPEIEFLREYSNYLTPRKGFLGADTWTAIAIYLRNLILNQSILVLFITAILLIPRALTTFAQKPPMWFASHYSFYAICASLIILLLAVPALCADMHNYTIDPQPDRALGRVIKPAKDCTHLSVKLFRSFTPPEFSRLLKSHPRVEIWDPSIMVRRNVGTACKLRQFAPTSDATGDTPEGTMTLETPVSADPGDLVIAIYPEMARAKGILSFIALPTFVGSMVLSCLLVRYGRYSGASFWTCLSSPWWWAIACASVFGILWLSAFVLFHPNLDKPEQGTVRRFLSVCFVPTSPLFAGAVGGLLLWKLTPLLQQWAREPAGMWKVLGFGTPIVSLIFLLFTVVQIGILGVAFSEPRREWWGRVAATLMIICFCWAAVFALAGYSPLILLRLFNYPISKWLTGIAWVVSTGVGVISGKSAKVGSPDSHTWKDAALSVTPYMFIVGLLMLVSLAVHASFMRAANQPVLQTAPREIGVRISGAGQESLQQPRNATLQLTVLQRQTNSVPSELYWKEVQISLTPRVYYALLICLALSFLLALRVDLNEFSMHYLYRNRLVRCYLGASHRERVPNPFTGFDLNDDIHLADLTTDNFYEGPIPIFGAALNLVHGKDLAWQERKAESFVMTPLFCGFDAWFEQSSRPGQRNTKGLETCGYRPTRNYAYPNGLYLGTAMAISGAAASPNMGYHSSPALAFLMTVFNVRLGWWVGNPRRHKYWQNAGPLVGLGYLLAELFGATDDSGRYVYLSDGGHFENLGLYELVKRRCRFILASDADADKGLAFNDLASAIRKCRADMGIEIKLRTDRFLASGNPPFSKWHCAVADILYKESDPDAENGILLYIKASLTSDEPTDVLNYKFQYPDFPHQSTADQWFSESQFESYRALGDHIIQTVLCGLPASSPPTLEGVPLRDLFGQLSDFWKNPENIQATRWPPDTGP